MFVIIKILMPIVWDHADIIITSYAYKQESMHKTIYVLNVTVNFLMVWQI
jgi:hypothetical protein